MFVIQLSAPPVTHSPNKKMHQTKVVKLKKKNINTQTGHYTMLSEISENVHPWDGFPCETVNLLQQS